MFKERLKSHFLYQPPLCHCEGSACDAQLPHHGPGKEIHSDQSEKRNFVELGCGNPIFPCHFCWVYAVVAKWLIFSAFFAETTDQVSNIWVAVVFFIHELTVGFSIVFCKYIPFKTVESAYLVSAGLAVLKWVPLAMLKGIKLSEETAQLSEELLSYLRLVNFV